MRVSVEIREKPLKYLNSLDKPIQELLFNAIEEKIAADPMRFGKPLKFALKGQRRVRVGKYRIVYFIEKEKDLATITIIGIRKNVYD